MPAKILLNAGLRTPLRSIVQRYENFMTPPNFKGSEFTLLSTKITILQIAVTVTVSVSVTVLSTEKLLYIIYYYIYNLYIIYIVKFTPTLFSRKFETETVTVTA